MNSTQFSPDYLARNRLKGAAYEEGERDYYKCVLLWSKMSSKKLPCVATQFSVRSVWRIKGEMKNSVFERINIKDGKKKCVKYKKPASKVYDNYVLSAIRRYMEIVCGVVLLT
jgi:hypothetical protein